MSNELPKYDRTASNQRNARLSTGPRTAEGPYCTVPVPVEPPVAQCRMQDVVDGSALLISGCDKVVLCDSKPFEERNSGLGGLFGGRMGTLRLYRVFSCQRARDS